VGDATIPLQQKMDELAFLEQGEWLQHLDKEGGGLPWLSLHNFALVCTCSLPRQCFFSVQLPAMPQSANADSDPLTYAVAAPLCTHNGQKSLTGML